MAVSIQSLPKRTGAESFIGLTARTEKTFIKLGGSFL